jgi:hypothetical protein
MSICSILGTAPVFAAMVVYSGNMKVKMAPGNGVEVAAEEVVGVLLRRGAWGSLTELRVDCWGSSV